MEPAETYALTHAKSAPRGCQLNFGQPPVRGVIVAAGPDVKAFEQPPLLIDLAPTILAALDAPASIEHTGVLHELVGSDAQVGKRTDEPPRSAFQIPGMGGGQEASNVTDIEVDEMEEHLRGLGYLE